jgi:elongation factor 2
MPKVSVEELKKLSENKQNIRNIGIIAHIDHGKTTFSDNLLSRAGFISEELAGKQLFMDFDPQEQERGITIYAANVSMAHTFEGEDYLINMIDTPGHVDFGGDVTRAMRAVDGAIILIDAVEGIMPQTETVLMQALKERVRPVLFINKVDRLIRELQLTPQAMQERFIKIIYEVNNLIQRLAPEEFKDKWKVNVEAGQVCFGSALRNWAISFPQMKKSGIDFKQVIEHVKEGRDKELAKKSPLHETVLDMVVKHLPNPKEAQKYRLKSIWKGDQESEIGKNMAECDDSGKFVGIITAVQNDPYAGTICTARIFSGKIKDGMEIYGIRSHTVQRVQQVGIYAGPRKIRIEELGSGNIVALTGVDFPAGETIVEQGVIMEPFEKIEHIFEPVVTKSIEPVKTAELPKLIKMLKDRAKEDPTIKVNINEDTGEILVSGLGELHIEAKIERFLKDRGIEIKVSKPIVVYRESVKGKSKIMEGKSPNRHNRFMLSVEPLEREVYDLLVKGELREGRVRLQDREFVRKKLIEAGMNKEEAFVVKDIYGHNLYLDMTKGIQYLNEVEEMIIEAFHSVADEGPLAREPSMSMKVKLWDAKLHEDAIHRGPAQVIPAVRFSIKNAMLDGGAIIIEPKQIIRIDAPTEQIGGAIREVSNRRGQILDMTEAYGYSTIKAKIPVSEIFGFEAALKGATGGKGFYSIVDQVFEPLPDNLQEKVILSIRKRKGLPEEIPKVEEVL